MNTKSRRTRCITSKQPSPVTSQYGLVRRVRPNASRGCIRALAFAGSLTQVIVPIDPNLFAMFGMYFRIFVIYSRSKASIYSNKVIDNGCPLTSDHMKTNAFGLARSRAGGWGIEKADVECQMRWPVTKKEGKEGRAQWEFMSWIKWLLRLHRRDEQFIPKNLTGIIDEILGIFQLVRCTNVKGDFCRNNRNSIDKEYNYPRWSNQTKPNHTKTNHSFLDSHLPLHRFAVLESALVDEFVVL